MKKEKISCDKIILAGISVRTNNKNEMEERKAKIGSLFEKYWTGGLADKIPNRKDAGRTFSVYTDYETDEHGNYTYFMGEEMTDAGELPEGLETITIDASTYQKFTTAPGIIPDVIIGAWRQIWMMGEQDFEGKRAYKADFEVLDVKTLDPQNAVFDIYVGVA